MFKLWYPGRAPFCALEIGELLDLTIDALAHLLESKSGTHLNTLKRICDTAITIIEAENEECLGTDSNLTHLQELFTNTYQAASIFYKTEAWPHLYELATDVTVAKNALDETSQGVAL